MAVGKKTPAKGTKANGAARSGPVKKAGPKGQAKAK